MAAQLVRAALLPSAQVQRARVTPARSHWPRVHLRPVVRAPCALRLARAVLVLAHRLRLLLAAQQRLVVSVAPLRWLQAVVAAAVSWISALALVRQVLVAAPHSRVRASVLLQAVGPPQVVHFA